MKKLLLILLVSATALFLLQVTGCEGVSGPRGLTGDPGDPGDPYQAPIPENRFFSLAIANNSLVEHNGAPKLYLAFDTVHANAGDTVVCQRLGSTVPPTVDGVDGGSAEWGAKFTNVRLYRAAGRFNFIESALVRAAYDNEYVYFLVKWTEVADSAFGLTVGESNDPIRWVYPQDTTGSDTIKRWDKVATGDEDRVMLLFEISDVFWYKHDGCLVTCHAGDEETNYHNTRSNKERMDVWSWSSVSSNPTGYADDKFMDNTSRGGIKGDVGTPPRRENWLYVVAGEDTTDHPLYQHIDDPGRNAPYPLWDWQLAKLAARGWRPGYTIPTFVTTIPSGSRADVVARGLYDNGTWTVEFRRARITGNGDDVKF